jgi:NAD(P)H-nitrite reductase large subunit
MKYLIIGSGISGTTAAEELRKIDGNCEITILSTEEHRLYSRVLLPRYIKGTLPRERCFLKKETWSDEQNIRCVFGVRVVELNVAENLVSTADGQTFDYDKLLLATSGDLLKFPTDLQGISYLRTIDDADHFLELLAKFESLPTNLRRAGIIGGSFIAVEYINFFAQHKIPTDLFMLENSFFGGALDKGSFAILKAKIETEGIKIHTNKSVTKLIGEKNIEGLEVGDETFPLGILGVGIGVRPKFDWLKIAGIEVNRGILTNEFLETNQPNIYASGDVAEFYDSFAKRQIVVGNWLNAQAQGRCVAKTMAGERTAFSAVRAYSTNVSGVEVVFIGDTEAKFAEKIIKRGSQAENGVTQIFIRDNRVVGATLVNRNVDRAELTQLIQSKASAANL